MLCVCDKDLTYLTSQQTNISRHEESCQRVETEKASKSSKKKKCSKRPPTCGTITKFFPKRAKADVDDECVIIPPSVIPIPPSDPVDVDVDNKIIDVDECVIIPPSDLVDISMF